MSVALLPHQHQPAAAATAMAYMHASTRKGATRELIQDFMLVAADADDFSCRLLFFLLVSWYLISATTNNT